MRTTGNVAILVTSAMSPMQAAAWYRTLALLRQGHVHCGALLFFQCRGGEHSLALAWAAPMASTPSVPPAQLALRFSLELAALVALAAWARHAVGHGIAGWLAMVGLPLVGASLWGVFAVPGDPSRSGRAVVGVPGWLRLLLELSVFLGGAAVLAAMHEWTWFAVDVAALVVHHVGTTPRLTWLLGQPRRASESDADSDIPR
jgi:hypothetical protein